MFVLVHVKYVVSVTTIYGRLLAVNTAPSKQKCQNGVNAGRLVYFITWFSGTFPYIKSS